MEGIIFDRFSGRWSGACPRCAKDSFFEIKSNFQTGKGIGVETLYCPGGHAIVAEFISQQNGDKKLVACYPREHIGKVPEWLPENYKSAYFELLKAKKNELKRSVIALCGILLEAHVNELIKNPGERKLSLFKKLEFLYEKEIIDRDQFSNGTITRITRNEVMHPEEILQDISDEDVESAFEEVTGFFERSYRWRSSKALPAPEVSEVKK